MAITHLSISFSILLLSLIVVASATGYEYVSESELKKPKTNDYGYAPKPELQKSKEKNYEYVPKPEVEMPKTDGYKYAPIPELEKPKANGYGYVPKSKLEKSKTDGYMYAPKPEVEKPNTNGYGYTPKLDVEKPHTNGYDYAPKLKAEKPKTNGYVYVPEPKVEKPKTNGYGYTLESEVEKPKTNGNGYLPNLELDKPKKLGKLLPCTTGIQGIIYCKSGPKLIPLEGAVARITCLGADKNGYKSVPFSVLSHPTDAKGYFFATMSPPEIEDAWKLTECKAFLEKSPLETCNVPTDVNNGISGAPLSSFHLLEDKNMKLFSVAPFVYNSEPKPVSNGY
ncbi:proline-rich protein 3-like [Actinidia eriantha]|uniref:proline-rich protein 3-like n=1 Tax=Actinidia eriantha TaxID=165200 RepID=UPI00258A8CE2|nr:proline-rich protein 3-like [Actinidia eriantha]